MQKDDRRPLPLARLLLSVALCGIAASLMGHALAQQAVVDQDDKSLPAGVSVPDAPGASERLDKAREKEFQKQWKTAAEFYQEAIAQYPGRVVPVKRDTDNAIYQYGGISVVAGDRISKWPAEGLAVYRTAYGSVAADLLASAPHGDTAALQNVFWNYFPTDAGKTAGIRLLESNLERGDFQAAMWIGNRLLTVHPSLGADRAAIVYRTAIASYRGGDVNQAGALLHELQSKYPTDVGSIGGKDVSLVGSLTAMLAMPPLLPTTRPEDADTYPSFGGLGGSGSLSTSSARPGASLNSITLTKPEFAGIVNQLGQNYRDADRTTINNNMAMGIMPVVDGGSLFFQDGRCVYAADADSGAPLPGWLNTYGGDRLGRYKLNVPGRVRNEPLTITVTPTSVVAIMGQPDRSSQALNNNPFMMQGQPPGPPSPIRLVCLDRDTGKELWNKSTTELPEPAAAVRTGFFSGTPLVIPANLTPYGEDCVMAIARGGRENQFDDCYAICMSLKTGQFKWSTYLGSATRSYDAEGGDPSQASLADGRVFVMTNLGTVTALNPSDGRILWLNSYAREGILNQEQMFLNGRRFNNGIQQQPTSSTGSWAQNPVFVTDGCVFVLPRDAKQLFIYDANTGAKLNQLPMSAFDDSEVLVGVRDRFVCLTSRRQLLVVDWRKYQEGDQKMATKWHEDLFNTDDSDVCGRGFMTEDSIYIPTKYRLREIGWKSRRILRDYPSNGTFTNGEGPGNILVTAHDVVVAGQTRVDVYTDLSLVRQRFETAIAASPNDPAPRLGYAEVLFAGGDLDGALQRIDQAIDLIGGISNMRGGRERQDIFNTLLDFAARANKNRVKDVSPEILAWEGKFYDRAAATANSPIENALYRRSRGQFDHSHADYNGEIQLYQEILSDAGMRDAMISDDQSAGTAAESAIEIAMKTKPSAYAPVEEQAAEALKAARKANDTARLLDVATVFPNSKAAVDAREDVVHRFEADNQPDKAISVLRRMYASTTDGGKRADILLSIANDFLTMPDGLGPALDRLCRAERIAQTTVLIQKLRLPDGTTLADIPFAEAVVKLRQIQATQQNAKLPDFHLATPEPRLINPFVHGTPAKIENVQCFVHPLRDFCRADQILTWGTNGLSIYPAGTTTPMATVSQIDKIPVASAWMHDHWLVWTSSDVYQISAEGRLTWDFPLVHLPVLLVSSGSDATMVNEVVDGTTDDSVAFVNGGVNPQLRIIAGVNGQQRIIRNFGGNVVVQPVVPPPPVAVAIHGEETITAVQPGGDRVIVSTTSGRVMGLDFRSGQIAWQTRPLDHAVDELLVNPHFTVARLDDPGGSQIAVYDTATGATVGRRHYGPDNTPTQLVNVALSEEATLAITEYSQIFVKDLYEPWKQPALQLVAQNNRDVAPYVGLTQPDQLIVQGGRLACLYDQGLQARGYDLSRAGDPTDPKGTATSTAVVSMRMIGPRLYIQTSGLVLQYNLDDKTDHSNCDIGQQDFIPKVHSVMIGKDYLVTVNDPVDRGPIGQPFVVLGAFSRAIRPGTTKEWSSFDFEPKVTSAAGIMDWIGADGGLYYLSKDANLHLLRGARP